MTKRYDQITYEVVNNTLCNPTKSRQFMEYLTTKTNNYPKWILSFGGSENIKNEVGNLALDLITVDMYDSDIKEIIDCVADISTNREQYIVWVYKFIKPSYSARTIKEILKSIAQLDYPKLDPILTIVEKYKTERCHILINLMATLFKILSKMITNLNEITEIITSIVVSFENILHKDNLKDDIDAILNDCYVKAFEVHPQDILTNWIKSLTATLLFFELPLRKDNYSKFKPMLNLIQDMVKSNCETQVITLFNQHVRPKITQDVYEYLICLKTIYDIEENEREELVKLSVYFLGNLKTTGVFKNIVTRISQIPNNRTRVGMIPNNRFNVVARSLIFLHNLDTMSTNYYEKVYQTLDCKIHNKMYMGDMKKIAQLTNSPYTVGINIHAEDRVKRTNDAINVLINSWNPTLDLISEFFSLFWQELMLLENNEKQEAILDTLGWNLNGSIRTPKNKQSFGGLLSGGDGMVTLGNKKIHGQELIARFWHFACTYEPKENENQEEESNNIKQSIFNNLQDGLEDDTHKQLTYAEHVVCDDGKVQRLVCSTLQGRLKDKNGLYIDVDKLGLNDVVLKIKTEIKPKQVDSYITNFEVIHQYMIPFINQLNSQKAKEQEDKKQNKFKGIQDTSIGNCVPTSSNEFFRTVFEYVDGLANGVITGFIGENILLDVKQVAYYIRLISPSGKGIELDINPVGSILSSYAELYDYQDLFQVEDYMQQFGIEERQKLKEDIANRKKLK